MPGAVPGRALPQSSEGRGGGGHGDRPYRLRLCPRRHPVGDSPAFHRKNHRPHHVLCRRGGLSPHQKPQPVSAPPGCFRAGQLVSLSVLPLRRRSGRHPADAPQCHLYHFSGRSGGPHPQEPAPLLCLEGPADFAPVHPVCPGGLGLHRRGDYPGVRLLLWQLEAPPCTAWWSCWTWGCSPC